MGSPLWSILVFKIPEFFRWKLGDQNFVPFNSGNIRIKKSKEPGFTFSIELRTKSSLSHGLLHFWGKYIWIILKEKSLLIHPTELPKDNWDLLQPRNYKNFGLFSWENYLPKYSYLFHVQLVTISYSYIYVLQVKIGIS